MGGTHQPCIDSVTHHQETLALDVLKAVVRSWPGSFLLVSAKGRIAGASERAAARLGTKAEDLEGQNLDRVFEEPAEKLVALLRRGDREEETRYIELTPRVPGWSGHLYCSVTPLEPSHDRLEPANILHMADEPADTGRVRALSQQVATLENEVGKRKRIELSLEAAQARAEAIVETAVDGIVTIDGGGIIQTVNGAMLETFGYQPEELIGNNVSMLMPQPYRDEHDGYMQTYLETGVKRIIGIGRVVSGLRKDGSEFPMELKVGEFRVQGARRFAGFIHDITARRQMEETLRQREETLRITLEQAPSGIVNLSLDGYIRNANRAFCSLLGTTEEQLTGRHFTELCHPDDDRNCKDVTAQLIKSETPSLHFDCRLLCGDGRTLHVQIYVAVPRDRKGAPTNLIVQIVDRSEERRHADEAREHRERLAHVTRVMTMGEMAAGIAHEINQPLAAIATYSQACHRMIASDSFDKDELLQAMNEVTAQAERAGDVIRHLRAMVKQGQVARQYTDLNAVVSEAIRLANLDAQTVDTPIELALAEDLPMVEADVIQIQQVLLNLIRNAIEAMVKHHAGENRISISTSAYDGDHLLVAVKDTGPGIPEAVADKLFKPFFTTKGTGLGMGLSISQSIIRSHGGRLWFEPGEACGMVFCFTLPKALGASDARSN